MCPLHQWVVGYVVRGSRLFALAGCASSRSIGETSTRLRVSILSVALGRNFRLRGFNADKIAEHSGRM